MKNKKGFTLIELLAVIGILALIIVIALPNVMKYFNEAKKESYMNEVKNIFKTAENQWMNDSASIAQERIYSKSNSSNCPNKLSLSGRDNIEYYVVVDKSGKITKYVVKDGTYQYFYSGMGLNIDEIEDVMEVEKISDNSKITINCSSIEEATHIAEEVDSSCTKTTPGCEVIVGGENFYVVSSNSTETLLLAKYDLKQDGNNFTQDTSGTTDNVILISFSNIGYWDGCKTVYVNYNSSCSSSPSGILSPYNNDGASYCSNQTDTNCAYVYDSNSDLYNYINKYASKISSKSGVTLFGRLMSLEEANSLKNVNSNAINDMNDYMYWLGSATNSYRLFSVNLNGGVGTNRMNFENGIRPLLVVSTSSL